MAAAEVVGSKRKALDIGDQERLVKRFDLLNLSANGHKHYLPVASDEQQQEQQQQAHQPPAAAAAAPPPTPSCPPPINESMQVEDTKHRVYIHDLDRELAELSSDDDDAQHRPIFIPDIDKHLSKLPHQLLLGRGRRDNGLHHELPAADKQLVLYNVPKSISLAAEDDSVGKALLESRNRARLEQRARIKREQRGEMDVVEEEEQQPPEEDGLGEDGRPRRVFARLRWKDTPPNAAGDDDDDAVAPLPMSVEDAEDSTPEPVAGGEVDDADDAMDLG